MQGKKYINSFSVKNEVKEPETIKKSCQSTKDKNNSGKKQVDLTDKILNQE